MNITNPFKQLEGLGLTSVIREIKERNAAEKRLRSMQDRYKEILNDPRYASIRFEYASVLGEQLRLLVSEASKCNNCCKRAERIKLLTDVIDQPVQVAWHAHMQNQAAEEAAEDGNG